MTLPASGAINLTQITQEFGLAINARFPAAFYGRGGAPASGPLRLTNFYGRSGISVIVSIAPALTNTASLALFSQGSHTASATGGAVTVYLWGILANNTGQATVVSGGSTATATLRGGDGTDTFYCDMTVGGTVYRATCSRSHHSTS